MLGFQTNTSNGGRAGLEPAQAWFEVVKWQALAAKQVAQELHFSTIWSWGWTSYTGNKDPDFGKAACVWLWMRSSSLCNGPGGAGPGWNSSTHGRPARLPRRHAVHRRQGQDLAVVDLAARGADGRPRARVHGRSSRATIESRLAHGDARAGARGRARADRRTASADRAPRTRRRSPARTCRCRSRGRSSATSSGASCSSGRMHVAAADRGAGARTSTSRIPDMLVRAGEVEAGAVVARRQDEGLRARGRRARERVPARTAWRRWRSGPSRAPTRCVRWARRSRSGRCRCRSSRPAIRVALSRSRAATRSRNGRRRCRPPSSRTRSAAATTFRRPAPVELATFVPFLSVGAARARLALDAEQLRLAALLRAVERVVRALEERRGVLALDELGDAARERQPLDRRRSARSRPPPRRARRAAPPAEPRPPGGRSRTRRRRRGRRCPTRAERRAGAPPSRRARRRRRDDRRAR